MADASGRKVQCVVVTPERAVLDEAVDSVTVPMFDGGMGVYPGRAPVIGRLGFGEMKVVQGNTSQRFFIDGGFVQVRSNVVTLLTPRALKAEEINVAQAEAALQAAKAPGKTGAAAEAQLKAQERARALLRMARR